VSRTFTLTCHVTVSAYTEVEAETLEDAIRIARSRPVDYDQAGNEASESWLVGEFDGEAFNIKDQDA
jgi:hypothetical protein